MFLFGCLVVLHLTVFGLFNVGMVGVSLNTDNEICSPPTIVACAKSVSSSESGEEILDEYDDSEFDSSDSDSFSDSI